MRKRNGGRTKRHFAKIGCAARQAQPKSRGIPPGLPPSFQHRDATREVAVAPEVSPQTFLTVGEIEATAPPPEPSMLLQGGVAPAIDRRALRRQQAARRREVLTKQANFQLEIQPQILRNIKDFKYAERLAIRRKDKELERFLRRNAKECVRHWMKFFRRYRAAGRPRGTGHPKTKLADSLQRIGLGPKAETKLRKAGLTDRDFRILYAYVTTGSQTTAARELGITKQAVSKTFRHRIEPALRKINPKFSPQFLRDVTAETAALSQSK